jgi:pimeloyl-ACP methyl ester carboxylesterase
MMSASHRKKECPLFKTQLETFGKILVIYSHGNASDLGDVYFFGEAVCIEFEVDFLAYDYSGYGPNKSRYTPNERSTYEDLQSILAFAVCNLGFQIDQIILWGYSLGSGPTCEIATRYTQIGAVIL